MTSTIDATISSAKQGPCSNDESLCVSLRAKVKAFEISKIDHHYHY